MKKQPEQTGLLFGKGEISRFLNGASDYMLKKFLEMGMPVVIVGGQWMAHRENIEEFFRHYTKKKVANPDGAMRVESQKGDPDTEP